MKEIDLEYLKLSNGPQNMRKENVCAECEMTGDLIECEGSCQRTFHPDCAGLLKKTQNFKCDECSSGLHICFLCKNQRMMLI